MLSYFILTEIGGKTLWYHTLSVDGKGFVCTDCKKDEDKKFIQKIKRRIQRYQRKENSDKICHLCGKPPDGESYSLNLTIVKKRIRFCRPCYDTYKEKIQRKLV